MTPYWLVAAALLAALPAPGRRAARVRSRPGLPPQLIRVVAAGAVAAIALGLLGGLAGLVTAVLGAAVTWELWPRIAARVGRDAGELARVPLVLDLVATVLRTGAPVERALSAASAAAGPVLRRQLEQVSGLLRLGATPSDAWAAIEADPDLRPVAVVAVRSAHSGIRLAAGWSALALELRAQALGRATERATRAGTWVMAPLGLCFLPAFVCLGIAPVVVGIATGLVSGGLL